MSFVVCDGAEFNEQTALHDLVPRSLHIRPSPLTLIATPSGESVTGKMQVHRQRDSQLSTMRTSAPVAANFDSEKAVKWLPEGPTKVSIINFVG